MSGFCLAVVKLGLKNFREGEDLQPINHQKNIQITIHIFRLKNCVVY